MAFLNSVRKNAPSPFPRGRKAFSAREQRSPAGLPAGTWNRTSGGTDRRWRGSSTPHRMVTVPGAEFTAEIQRLRGRAPLFENTVPIPGNRSGASGRGIAFPLTCETAAGLCPGGKKYESGRMEKRTPRALSRLAERRRRAASPSVFRDASIPSSVRQTSLFTRTVRKRSPMPSHMGRLSGPVPAA